MTETKGFKWWRFNEYQLNPPDQSAPRRKAGHIGPAPGAKLEQYDPWQSYRAARSRRKGGVPPYHDFDITVLPREPLLTWCAKYGLPGTLLQIADSVELAPRWQPYKDSKDVLVPTRTTYFRGNAGWSSWTTQVGPTSRAYLSTDPEQQGQLVAQDSIPTQWGRPHVVIKPIGKPMREVQQLGKTWSRFFPAVPEDESETYPYPMPGSEEFWALYAESEEAFMEGMGAFGLAQRHFLPSDMGGDVSKGLEILNDLVGTSSPALELNPEGLVEKRWVSPSLLGMFAMMFLLNLQEGHRVLICNVCGRLFVSAAYQARYCSSTCSNRAQKRVYRKRKKAQRL